MTNTKSVSHEQGRFAFPVREMTDEEYRLHLALTSCVNHEGSPTWRQP